MGCSGSHATRSDVGRVLLQLDDVRMQGLHKSVCRVLISYACLPLRQSGDGTILWRRAHRAGDFAIPIALRLQSRRPYRTAPPATVVPASAGGLQLPRAVGDPHTAGGHAARCILS
jgi:hypothetical protein